MNYTMLRNRTNGLESVNSPFEYVYFPLESEDSIRIRTVYSMLKSVYFLLESVYSPLESVHSLFESVYFPLESVYSLLESVYSLLESVYSLLKSVYFWNCGQFWNLAIFCKFWNFFLKISNFCNWDILKFYPVLAILENRRFWNFWKISAISKKFVQF